MSQNDFFAAQQDAVERMREMNRRATPHNSGRPMPPIPSFVRLQGNNSNSNQNNSRERGRHAEFNREPPKTQEANHKDNPPPKKSGSFLDGLNLPFLDKLKGEADIALIIGLILILMSEKADKKLLFALIYILM